MARLNRILSIARFDFVTTVTRPAYAISLLLVSGGFMLIGSLGGKAARPAVGFAPRASAGAALVDRAGIARATEAEGTQGSSLRRYTDLESAIRDLRSQIVDTVYEVPPDYLQTGRVNCYRRESVLFDRPPASQTDELASVLRDGLVPGALPPGRRERLLKPVRLHDLRLGAGGQLVSLPSDGERRSRLIFLGLLAFGLIAMITIASSYLLQSVSTERENHVIDVILTYVTPEELMAGKLLGLSAACVSPAVVFLGLFALQLPAGLNAYVSARQLLLAGLFLLLGYSFMAALMVAGGMLIDVSRESSLVALFWTAWALVPVLGFLQGRAWLLTAMSYFPLTSPITVLLRISFANVPPIELAGAAATLIAATLGCLKLAAALIRLSASRFGPRSGLILSS